MYLRFFLATLLCVTISSSAQETTQEKAQQVFMDKNYLLIQNPHGRGVTLFKNVGKDLENVCWDERGFYPGQWVSIHKDMENGHVMIVIKAPIKVYHPVLDLTLSTVWNKRVIVITPLGSIMEKR